MKIKIVNQSKHPLPEYKTKSSAGMDIRANLSGMVTLSPLERKLIPTGLFIELPEGYEAQIRPRSGLALNEGLGILNSPGTIDADYRGGNRGDCGESVEPCHHHRRRGTDLPDGHQPGGAGGMDSGGDAGGFRTWRRRIRTYR